MPQKKLATLTTHLCTTDVQYYEYETNESKTGSETCILIPQTVCSWLRAVHEGCESSLPVWHGPFLASIMSRSHTDKSLEHAGARVLDNAFDMHVLYLFVSYRIRY